MGRNETDKKKWPWDSKTPTKVGWYGFRTAIIHLLVEICQPDDILLASDSHGGYMRLKYHPEGEWLPLHIGELPKPELDCSIDEVVDEINNDDWLIEKLTNSGFPAYTGTIIDRVTNILKSHRIKEEATDATDE